MYLRQFLASWLPLLKSHLDLLIPGDEVQFVLTLLLMQIKCQVKCLNHFHPLHTKVIFWNLIDRIKRILTEISDLKSFFLSPESPT